MPSPSDSDRVVNDLLWAINSPSLLNNIAEIPSLDQSDIHRKNLAQTIGANPNRRVGKYFEQLIGFWLSSNRGVSDLEHSRQIRDGKQTIGELDFLFTDQQGRRTHLETAVKFYLYVPDIVVQGSHFIGPNAGDTFERKTNRLFDHQLPLGRQHIGDIDQTIALVKGRIFYHPDREAPQRLPARLAPNHLRGSWIRQCETQYFDDQDPRSRFCVMRKPHWLADESATINDAALLNSAEMTISLNHHFRQSNHPVLVSQFSEIENGYQESNRIFVVETSWPSSKKVG